ncbi:MAG: peptide chain release factor N(5)-glutamine methyltransferase [Pseudomonadota bacterium]
MEPDINEAETLGALVRSGAALLSGADTARLDARVLLKHVLEIDDAGLIARSGEAVSAEVRTRFLDLLRRRMGGEPVAHIVGVKEFWSLPFSVTPDALVPRGDSECLIEAIIERRDRSRAWRIADLGSGSGCLLAALLSEYPGAEGIGVDISLAAVELARSNCEALGLGSRASFIVSDWLSGLSGSFDIIIANAPYIPAGKRDQLAVDVAGFEPSIALFAGVDGLDAYRDILRNLPGYLAAGALVVFEYGGEEQGRALRGMIDEQLAPASVQIIRDLGARERGVAISFH